MPHGSGTAFWAQTEVMCRRIARSFRCKAVIQLFLLPLLSLAWLLSALYGIIFRRCMPFTLADVRANLRRARQVEESLRRANSQGR